MNFTNKEKNIIKKALLIRNTEETLLSLFKQGDINGTVHTCVGQEFIGAVLSNIINDIDLTLKGMIIINESNNLRWPHTNEL